MQPASPSDGNFGSGPGVWPVMVTSTAVSEPPRGPVSSRTPFDWRGAIVWLAILAGVYHFAPRLVEEMEYALTRGKQRAEYDMAGERLNEVSLEGLSHHAERVFQRIRPSVVHLDVETTSLPDNDPHAGLPNFPGFPEQTGQGSGVVFDSAGWIITNYHVVRGAKQVRITLSDGRRLPGQVAGFDAETDLAVIRVAAEGLPAVAWGSSDDLPIGAMVWSVGSPFGLHDSFTSGIVSAKHRAGMAGTPYQDFLQTDCAVNPGNSGGPLVDARGVVVGINTAIVGESFKGISFAVPGEVARVVAQRIRDNGSMVRGWLGVRLGDVALNGQPAENGAYIVEVPTSDKQKSPAELAGIRAGDIVIKWNDDAVSSSSQLSRLVGATPVGSDATLILKRAGREQVVRVRIAERP